MEDFQSKYSGEQVEGFLDQIANGEIGGGGGIAVETDPIFSASPAASITEEKKTEWDNKVDKVSGKQLSTEDFTSALKTKLEGLSNYDDTELSEAISTLRGDFDKLVSGDTTTAIKTFNEVIAFLDGIQDSQDLSSIIASIEQQIAGKMDKVTLATVATSGSYNDLSNKPTIPSEQVNADWNATSGKAQILNKPTIPSAVTESTVSGWGFTKNTGTYSKPSGGIPKTDLASAVQTSLGKADTALQSYTEQYKGTVTKVKINGSEKTPDADGLVDLGTVEGSSSGGGEGKQIITLEDTSIDLGETPVVDNTIYVYTEPITTIMLGGLGGYFAFETSKDYGEALVLFTTGSYTTFWCTEVMLWPNGTFPTLEPNTAYELSITATKVGGDYVYKAVLTPFKLIE